WVQFKIKVKSDLPFGSEIKNHASIYFDFNSPIFTNEAVNYIGTNLKYEVGDKPFIVPNAVSPNNDDRNETWYILNMDKLKERDVKVKSIVILNRWGQKVASGYNDSFVWHPLQMPTDVYAYMIVYSVHSGTVYTQSGNITIIH
nr:gliding motility-associated C-terminal domain-containing protein [Chitinophagaceae bacterium]